MTTEQKAPETNGLSLPPAWEEASLDVLVESDKGTRPIILGEKSGTLTTPYITIRIFEGAQPTEYCDPTGLPTCEPNDILVVWDGARCGLVGRGASGVVGSTLVRLRPILIEPSYLFYFLQSQYAYLNTHSKGVGIPHIEPTRFWKLRVPIAPLPEQKRIVEEIEKQLVRLNVGATALHRAQARLQRFRASVLKTACDGPWPLTKLGDCFKLERGRFSHRPRNEPRFYNGRYPFIQIGDLPRDGGSIAKYTQTLNEKGLAISRLFPKGTVLIAIVGATIGNTGILMFDSCAPDSIIGLQSSDATLCRYAEIYLRSKKQMLRAASYASGGQPNINLPFLQAYPFPLPPSGERERIVAHVDQQLSSVDQLETQLESKSQQADNLRQSLFGRAFTGGLVPQDPNDEPAHSFLQRITATTEARGILRKSAKMKRPAKRIPAIRHRPLLEVLSEHPEGISPEALLREANYDIITEIDEFYRDLSAVADKFDEAKPQGAMAKKWPNNANVTLRLRKA
jgi:type I restriction enzyme S subunit